MSTGRAGFFHIGKPILGKNVFPDPAPGKTRPAATTFLLDGSEPAILRLEQDTIYILVASPAGRLSSGKASRPVRYDRLGFFLNRYSELESHITSGLNRKIQMIDESKRKNDSWITKNGRNYMVADPTVSAVTALIHNGNKLELNGFVLLPGFFTGLPDRKTGHPCGTAYLPAYARRLESIKGRSSSRPLFVL